MAVNLTEGAGNDRISWGDLAVIGGQSALTWCVSLTPTAVAANRRIFGKWTGSFIGYYNATPKLSLGVFDGSGSTGFLSPTTGDGTLANGELSRIMWRWRTSDEACEIYKNGTLVASGTLSASQDNVADSASLLQIGHQTGDAVDAVEGDYAEAAIWGEYVPDWVTTAYGQGYAPTIYRTNLLFYAPLFNINDLIDRKGAAAGTATNGTDAAHPRMFYPHSNQDFRRIFVAPPSTQAPRSMHNYRQRRVA